MSNQFLELVNGKSWQWWRTADGQEFYRMIGESTCYTGDELLARIKSAIQQ